MAKLENKTKENPKLEQNKLSDGRISLYLEYYLGREEKPVLEIPLHGCQTTTLYTTLYSEVDNRHT